VLRLNRPVDRLGRDHSVGHDDSWIVQERGETALAIVVSPDRRQKRPDE
jgi:hypothetical protein